MLHKNKDATVLIPIFITSNSLFLMCIHLILNGILIFFELGAFYNQFKMFAFPYSISLYSYATEKYNQ